ncbi:MAG: helix-turn-helix transcriptional regulator [Clostridia bacterium]|nr:helix-turn-helix transcriptional regulator [Clostridia bacterium]MDR3643888.1 helix-turn-helix transcriptional regulator [Clostridia bacterium]
MNSDFPRILTLLRKEKGLSQKKAAEGLHVSQALLSHYEKGIRECGLEFVVSAASFYGVSCDYLLGRSPERTGALISVQEIPEPDAAGKENVFHGSLLPVLNKKLIANSLNIVYDLLQKAGHRELTSEVSNCLMLCVYKMFRHLYGANAKNPTGLFAVDKALFEELTSAAMMVSEMKVRCMTQGIAAEGIEPLESTAPLELTPESLAAQYPLFASSLTNLVSTVETSLGARKKS